MLVAELKKKYAANLDKMIEPDHPDFGPKNNQLLWFGDSFEAGLRLYETLWRTISRNPICMGIQLYVRVRLISI